MENFEEKLIEEVRNHKCLYDLSDPYNKMTIYKDKVWSKIGQSLSTDGEQCKKKWRSLRDMKRRATKMTQLASGSAASTPGKSKWRYAEAMAFLDGCQSYRSTIGNIPQPKKVGTATSVPSCEVPLPMMSPPIEQTFLISYSPQTGESLQSPQLFQLHSPSPSPSPLALAPVLPQPSPSAMPSPQPSPTQSSDYQRRKMRKQQKEDDEFTKFLNAASGTISGMSANISDGRQRSVAHFTIWPPLFMRATIERCRRIVHDAIDEYNSLQE